MYKNQRGWRTEIKGDLPEDHWSLAYEQYVNYKDYAGALTHFNSLLAKDPKNSTINFYAGVCYLTLDQPEKAELLFQTVLKNEHTPFTKHA